MSSESTKWTLATWLTYIFLIIIAVAIYYQIDDSGTSSTATSTPEKITQDLPSNYYRVNRVIDGDTIEINLNGTLEKVRLIGINTPETVDPNKEVECFGLQASNRMKYLAQNQYVRIENDDTQDFRDKYGRLLDYVYLKDGQMLNRKIISEGFAYEYTYSTPYKYQDEFRSLQNFARSQKLGLWAPSACAINN